MEFSTSGFVLSSTDVGDTNKILTILTPDYGKISVLAKGVRKASSKNSYGVQLFSYSDFEILSSSGGNILKTASVKNSFFDVSSDIEKFALASYLAEVASQVCQENNDESSMLRLVLNSFYALAKLESVPAANIKAAFEFKCSVILGYLPDFSGCGICGGDRDSCIRKDGKIYFSLSDGAFVCDKCSTDNSVYVVPLSHSVLSSLEELIILPINRMLSFSLCDEDCHDFYTFCEKYLAVQTGARFRTLAFYKSTVAVSENSSNKKEI